MNQPVNATDEFSAGPVGRPVRPVSSVGLPIEAYRCTWESGYVQYHDRHDQLPTEWDDAEPDEVAALVMSADATYEIERLREQLACVVQALPEPLRGMVPSVAVATIAAGWC